MPKKVHIRVLESGSLYYDFFYKGIRCKEYTNIQDTLENRKRLEKEAQIIATEIDLEKFDYLRHFPNGSRKHLFSGRPDGDIAFERYAMEVWLPHMQTKVRTSTLQDYEAILATSVFPLIGGLKLKDVRPEHIDQLTNMLRKRKGIKALDFERKKILVRCGIVRGVKTDLKTTASVRDVDMLPTVEEALAVEEQPRETYVFPNADGGPLDLTNLRVRIWFPTLTRARLRVRNLYQTRHTFASLMLQAGEDPAWIARMMGHTTTKMLFERYSRFIQYRTRQDGLAYLEASRRANRP